MYRSIVRKISESVMTFGDQPAVVDPKNGESFTYGELDDLARRIGAKLCRLGASHGSFVTIELPRKKKILPSADFA